MGAFSLYEWKKRELKRVKEEATSQVKQGQEDQTFRVKGQVRTGFKQNQIY